MTPTMEATMERMMSDLPGYLTVTQTAEVLGTTERRVRQWQQLGVLAPAARLGLLQYRRADVVRGAVLQHLQKIFGESSPLAVELAKAVPAEQLDAVLTAEKPQVTAVVGGRVFEIRDLDPDRLGQVRERLASVPV
jgi:hypothetical protein